MEYDELFKQAEEYFRADQYAKAERYLKELVLKDYKKALVFHMLGTIYYDSGKFNKAIRAFQRALEIDPSLTDASIGLSIIFNDLGRYEEGQKIFSEAQQRLKRKSVEDPKFNQLLSIKCTELGDLYFKYGHFEEALEHFQKALDLSIRKIGITMKIVECYVKEGYYEKAIHMLRALCKTHPRFMAGRLKLGKLYYDSHQVPMAILQWEHVLTVEPENLQAKEYLKLTDSIGVIHTVKDIGV